MSCAREWWEPGNAQVAIADMQNDDGTPATGLTLTAYLMRDENDATGDALASQLMAEGATVGAYRRYRTVISAETIDGVLKDSSAEDFEEGADEAVVVVIGTNIRRVIERVTYSYTDPELRVP